MSQHQILIDRARALQKDLVELASALVRIPTVNPYSADSTAGCELAGQQFIADLFKKEFGASVTLSEPPPDIFERAKVRGPKNRSWKNRPNAIARITIGSGRGKTIVLNNHMDTVGAEGMEIDPFSGKVEDGKIWGRGTSDTKGNTAVGITALRALLESPLAKECDGTILFQSVVDEECNGSGAGTMWACLEGHTGDLAICLDGTSAPQIGCNGILTYDIRVKGRSGHSSRGGSVNAIDKGVYIKQAIDRFRDQRERKDRTARVGIGVFRSGTIPAMIPGEALLGLNINYLCAEAAEAERGGQGWSGALVDAEFKTFIAEAAAADEFLKSHPPELSVVKDVYPYATPADHPLVRLACAALSQIHGSEVKPCVMEAWGDAGHLSRLGKMPTIGFGSTTPGYAHAAVECTDIEDLVKGASALTIVLYELLKKN